MIVSAWPWIQIPTSFQRRHSVTVLSFISIAPQATAVTRVSEWARPFSSTQLSPRCTAESLFVSLSVCSCACWYVSVCALVHTQGGQRSASGGLLNCFLPHFFFLIFFFWDSIPHKTQSSLIHLGWPFHEPCESTCLHSPVLELQILPLHPTFVWTLESKFRSTCLPDSYQLIHLPSSMQRLWNILNAITIINIIADVGITNVRISVSNISTNVI